MKFTNSPLSRVAALTILSCGLSMLVRGQSSTNTTSRGGRNDTVQREIDRKFEREIIENALKASPSRPARRYPPLVLEQIREDFLRIQVIDRKLARWSAGSNLLDLELVARSAGEIRKRAVRLKRNLALPEFNAEANPGPSVEVERGVADLRSLLSSLSSLIEQFVSNPVFQDSRLVDAGLSARARRDIDAIIEVSGAVRRSSERLKAPAKSP